MWLRIVPDDLPEPLTIGLMKSEATPWAARTLAAGNRLPAGDGDPPGDAATALERYAIAAGHPTRGLFGACTDFVIVPQSVAVADVADALGACCAHRRGARYFFLDFVALAEAQWHAEEHWRDALASCERAVVCLAPLGAPEVLSSKQSLRMLAAALEMGVDIDIALTSEDGLGAAAAGAAATASRVRALCRDVPEHFLTATLRGRAETYLGEAAERYVGRLDAGREAEAGVEDRGEGNGSSGVPSPRVIAI